MKLAFALEEIYLFSKQAYEIVCLGENEDSNSYFTLLKHSTECFQSVLTDFDVQVTDFYYLIVIYHLGKYISGGDFLCTGSINWITSSKKHCTERHQYGKQLLPSIFYWGTFCSYLHYNPEYLAGIFLFHNQIQ